jgi:hypothetical protein
MIVFRLDNKRNEVYGPEILLSLLKELANDPNYERNKYAG